jgi:hypothetical protein
MDLITSRSRELLDSKGPLSHGFYTSGQLMLEEYYTTSAVHRPVRVASRTAARRRAVQHAQRWARAAARSP